MHLSVKCVLDLEFLSAYNDSQMQIIATQENENVMMGIMDQRVIKKFKLLGLSTRKRHMNQDVAQCVLMDVQDLCRKIACNAL